MAGASGLRGGGQGYAGSWNAEDALRRIGVLESRIDKSGTSLPIAGEFFGQKFKLTTTGKWYAWDGTTWDILN